MPRSKISLASLVKDRTAALNVAIGVTFVLLAAACLWKYAMYAYNAIDLAYFSQVFWNTVHGRPFSQSLHPHLSLGDHAELIILLLAPAYALWQDPRTLLLLQAGALAACAFPIMRLAEARLGAACRKDGALSAFPLLLALAWLASPFVHNIALFEFHILPFALFPLLQALLAYERGRRRAFLCWSLLALLVREDVALVVAAIGILAWLERRERWWRLVPIILGGAWFLAMTRLIAAFAPGGGYKYLVYYLWLGRTPWEMAANAARDPLKLAAHLLTLPNLEMLLGFLMPLLFLPLLRPKRLVLALAPFLQIVLGAPGGGELVLQTHYATLFLPALWLAAIDGAAFLPDLGRRSSLRRLFRPEDWMRLCRALILVAAAFGAAALGPLPSVVTAMASPGELAARARAAADIVGRVPADAPVAASYALLPALSSRERLFSAHYVFLGVTQFAEGPYAAPSDLRFVALDADDLLTYRTQFLGTAWTKPHYEGGLERLSTALGPLSAFHSPFALYDRAGAGPATTLPPVIAVPSAARPLMSASEPKIEPTPAGRMLSLSALWNLDAGSAEALSAMLAVTDGKGRAALTVRQPLAAPPPFALPLPDGLVTAFSVSVDHLPPGRYALRLTLERQESFYTLDGLRSAARAVTSSETKSSADLPSFELR